MDNWILLMTKQKRLKAVEIESVDRNLMRTYFHGQYSPPFFSDQIRRFETFLRVCTLWICFKALYNPGKRQY